MQMHRWALAAWVAVLSLGCTSATRLSGTWKSSQYQGGKLQKILVVGMTPDDVLKGIFEDDMARALQARGVQAVPSHSVISTPGRPSKEQLEQVVKEGDYDAVIVTRPAGVEERTEYMPGAPDPLYGGFYDYYFGMSPVVYDPGYFRTTRTYKTVTNIYSTKNQPQLIWSATSESFEPSNREKAVKAIQQKLIEQMAKDGLV